MQAGDLVRYKVRIWNKDMSWLWQQGLLLEFDQTQRICQILDNETGNIIKMHCSDVQLVKVGNGNR